MFSTPKNIDTMSTEKILEEVYESPNQNIPNKEVRMQINKIVYGALGFDMDNDLLLALTSEPESQLVLATAGSGKTTFAQAKVVSEKIFRKARENKPLQGERVLCLVYNKHNVQPMIDAHQKMVSKLYSSNIKGLDIDMKIKAQTMHSFCTEWSAQYALKMNRVNFELLRDYEQKDLFNMCYKLVSQKHNVEPNYQKYADLIQLYSYLRETMRTYDNCDDLDLFNSLGIPKDVVVETFTQFDAFKKVKRKFDFTDTLIAIHKLLQEDEEARTFIQEYYDYIVADEVQDFNPIFMEILKLIKGPKTPLLCIGDEDQSIYGFRGANIKTVLNFSNEFPDAKVYSLGTNRRCREIIVDTAKEVLSWNKLRFDKSIKSIKPDGNVDFIPYNTDEGQLINLCNKLKTLSKKELENTCICYRNKKSSLMLSDKLVECGIDFNIISGYKPFSHELYRHVTDILDMLYRPYDREYVKNMYKILPYIKKGEFHKAIGYDPIKKTWKDGREKKHFSEYDLGKYNDNLIVKQYLNTLTEISKVITTIPMAQYMTTLYEMLSRSFWKDKMYLNDNQEVDLAFTEKTHALFSSKLTYPEFERIYEKHKRVFETNDKQSVGCTLSTFHSLKGLEFDNVFIIDLDDEIYPNFAGIDNVDYYTDDMKQGLKEEETRLFYVAVTRAIDNLTMYYCQGNPSLFIQRLMSEDKFEVEDELNINTILDKDKPKINIGINSRKLDINDLDDTLEESAKIDVDKEVEIKPQVNTQNVPTLDTSKVKEYTGKKVSLLSIGGQISDMDVPEVKLNVEKLAKEEVSNPINIETLEDELDDELDDELEEVSEESIMSTEDNITDNLDDDLDDELERVAPLEIATEIEEEKDIEQEESELKEEESKTPSRKSFLNSILNRL
ncbi:ATP-dependent helicase [Paraclostridium bifermentans]|uniref:ATP-dependent helicase n=1 Tax=Paraclostridium bifermentans TaxID=1490 RepID=UPI00374E398F